jgi:hypothetical protein
MLSVETLLGENTFKTETSNINPRKWIKFTCTRGKVRDEEIIFRKIGNNDKKKHNDKKNEEGRSQKTTKMNKQ